MKDFHIKKNRTEKLLIILLICVVVAFYIVKLYSRSLEDQINAGNMSVEIENIKGDVPVGEIFGNRTISQSFLSPKKDLAGFSIQLATYTRTNYCTLLIELVDVSNGNKVVFSEQVDGSLLSDNSYLDFYFGKLPDSENHLYHINISSPEAEPGNAVTTYASSENNYTDGELMIGSVPCEGDLNFIVYYEKFDIQLYREKYELFRLITIVFLVIAVGLASACLLFYMEDILKKSAKIVYLVISCILLLLFSSLFISKQSDNEIYAVFNPWGFGIWTGWILLIVFLEDKLHYVKWLKACVANKVQKVKGLKEKQDVKLLALYLATISINTVLIIFSAITSGFWWNRTCVFGLFILGSIAVAINILEQIFIEKSTAENIFLVVSLLLGLIMSYSFRPTAGMVWDGGTHYGRAEALRQVIFDSSYTRADERMTAYFYDTEVSGLMTENNNALILSDDEETINVPLQPMNLYSYIGYLPVAVMMAFADAVRADILKMVVLSRLCNSVLYTLVVYFSLRRMRSGIYLFASISLLPSILFLSASFTYDYWVTAFIVYGIAYLISELQTPEHKMTRKDCVAMFGAMALGCGPKAIYCILLILFFCMGKEKFESAKDYRLYRCVCILTILVILSSFMLPLFFNPGTLTDSRGGTGVSSPQQLQFILQHPIRYTKTLLRYMANYMSLEMFARWSSELGAWWENERIFRTISTMIVVFSMFVDKNQHDRFHNSTLFRASVLLVSFIQVAFICTALYISFTSVGAETIVGVQYRYTFPILSPLLYSIGSPKIDRKIDSRTMDLVVFGGTSISVLGSVYFVYLTNVL